MVDTTADDRLAGTGNSNRWQRVWPPSPPVLRGLGGVLGFLVLAEVLIRASPVSTSHLPPSSIVLVRASGLLANTEFLLDALTTLYVWILGLALSTVVAVPAGLVLGTLPAVRTATRSLVEFLRPIPPVALIPLAIVLFGTGTQMKLVLVVYGAVWPILFNTIYALGDVDPIAKDTARAFGFGPFSVLRRVSLPSAAPFIATGVRVSAAIALILTISAGLLSGGDMGIGTYIIELNTSPGNTDLVLAATGIAGVLGYLGLSGLERFERWLFAWHFLRAGGKV